MGLFSVTLLCAWRPPSALAIWLLLFLWWFPHFRCLCALFGEHQLVGTGPPVFWPSMSVFLLCFLSIFCFIFWETKMFLPGVKEYFFLDEWHYGNSNFTSEPGLSLWYHWHFRVTLCHGNYLVHWRMFSRIPGLYLLDTNSTVPSRPNQKCPQTLLISGQDP